LSLNPTNPTATAGGDESPETPTAPKGRSFSSLLQSTGIPRHALQETLLSLCSNKVKLLKRRSGASGAAKGSHGSPFSDSERVIVNDGMKSKLVRIVVHSHQGRLTKKDVEVRQVSV